LQTFRFLEDQYLYTPVYYEKEDTIFIESLDVEYINDIKRRKITISYTNANVYNESKYTFNLSITRIPYSGVEDFFSLSNYLQSKGKDFSTTLINNYDIQEAKKILGKLAIAIKENALGIMEGNQWLETYYTRKD
jgi:hypothetical protein